MLSICFTSLLYIFRFFPTGELFKVGAAPQKKLNVFYGQYIFLLKWPEAYVIICVCNTQWRKMTPTCNSFSGSKTSISMILTKNSIWFYSFHFFRETKTYLFFFQLSESQWPFKTSFWRLTCPWAILLGVWKPSGQVWAKASPGASRTSLRRKNDCWLVGWCRWCSACVMMGDLQDFSSKHNGYSSFFIVLLILRGTWSVFVFWPFKSLSLHFLFHDCFSMLNSHPFVSEFHATYWFRSSQDPRPSRIARMPCGRCLSNAIFLGPKLFHLGYGSRFGCQREHQHDHIWYWRIQLPIPILPPWGPVVLFWMGHIVSQ